MILIQIYTLKSMIFESGCVGFEHRFKRSEDLDSYPAHDTFT